MDLAPTAEPGFGSPGGTHRRRRRARELLWAAAAVGLLVVLSSASQAAAAAVLGGTTRHGAALVGGADASASCASGPCGEVVSLAWNEVQVSFSVGVDSAESPQPETYYTDLLRVTNPTASNFTVVSVTVGGVSMTRPGDLGAIGVFYCRAQTEDPAGTCRGSYEVVSAEGGTVYAGDDVVGPGAVRYIEFAGFAGAGATPGDQISFTIEVTTS